MPQASSKTHKAPILWFVAKRLPTYKAYNQNLSDNDLTQRSPQRVQIDPTKYQNWQSLSSSKLLRGDSIFNVPQ